MPAPIFIGDEISATGYRLAGMRVRVPAAEEVAETLRWARTHAPLVLITAERAKDIPAADLARAQAAVAPPVLVVPDIRCRVPIPDLATLLRRQLGVLE